MNVQESAAALAYLHAAFPYAAISEQTAQVWAQQLVGVDPRDGKEACDTIIRSEERFPSVAQYLQACRAAQRSRTGSQEGYESAGELEPAPNFTKTERDANVKRLLATMRQTIAAQGSAQHHHKDGEPCPVRLCPYNTTRAKLAGSGVSGE